MKRLTNIILILIFLILAFAILHMIVSRYVKKVPEEEVEQTFTMIRELEEVKTEEVTITFTDVITDIYKEFLKNFEKKDNHYYYSIVTMDNYKEPVLLISDGTYNYSREDASAKQAAMWTDIYYYIEESVTYLGHIS